MHLQKDIMNILDKTGFNCVEPTSEKGKYNIYINSRTPFNSDFGFYVVYDGSFQSFKKAVSKICYAFDIDKDAEKRIPIRESASIQRWICLLFGKGLDMDTQSKDFLSSRHMKQNI